MIARPVFVAVLGASLFVLFTPGPDVPTDVPVSDKVVHAGLFLLLAVTGRWAGLSTPTLLVELVLYAGLSEVLQAVLPIERDGDVLDFLADTAGVVVGLGGWRAGVRLASRHDGPGGAGRPPRRRWRR